MLNRKKYVVWMIIAVMAVVSLAGCGRSAAADTIATQLAAEFKEIAKQETGAGVIADKLSESKVLEELSMATMPVEEGYLNGFDGEIAGFTEGCMFAPMIGSIPFVGYVFETEDSVGLIKTLTDHGQLNWNICTTADEMVTETEGSYVFFVMAPEKFE